MAKKADPKFVRSEPQKKRRKLMSRTSRLLKLASEFLEEEPDVPVMLLVVRDSQVIGKASPWLSGLAETAGETMSDLSGSHQASSLMSGTKDEQTVKDVTGQICELLSVADGQTSLDSLRVLLPHVMRLMRKDHAKSLWDSSNKPSAWPVSVPFGDPNRTVDGHKMSVESIRSVFRCLQQQYKVVPVAKVNIPKKPTKLTVQELSDLLKKETHSSPMRAAYGSPVMNSNGKFTKAYQALTTDGDLVSTVVGHPSTLTLREVVGISHLLEFDQGSISARIKGLQEDTALLQLSDTWEEALATYVTTNPGQLNLLAKAHGLRHWYCYAKEYKRAADDAVQYHVSLNQLGLSSKLDFKDAMAEAVDKSLEGDLKLLLSAGALGACLHVTTGDKTTVFPPCLCDGQEAVIRLQSVGDKWAVAIDRTAIVGYKLRRNAKEKAKVIDLTSVPSLPHAASTSRKIVHGVALYTRDLETLQPKMWLSDAVVDAAAAHYLYGSGVTDVVLMPALFSQKLMVTGPLTNKPLDMSGQNLEGVQRWTVKRNIRIPEERAVLIPICNMVHWYLACYEVKKQTLSLMCSMGNSYQNEVNTIAMYLSQEYDRCGEDKPNIVISHPKVAQQTNSFDCGIYVISYMRNAILGKEEPVLTRGAILAALI